MQEGTRVQVKESVFRSGTWKPWASVPAPRGVVVGTLANPGSAMKLTGLTNEVEVRWSNGHRSWTPINHLQEAS